MNPLQTRLKPDFATQQLPWKENKPNPMNKRDSNPNFLLSKMSLLFRLIFFSAILDIPMIVTFSFCKVLHILFIYWTRNFCFCKMAKAWLSYMLYMKLLYCRFMCSLSISKYFLCELSKDCNKNIPHNGASYLVYLLLICMLAFLVSLTLVFLISDSSWSN